MRASYSDDETGVARRPRPTRTRSSGDLSADPFPSPATVDKNVIHALFMKRLCRGVFWALNVFGRTPASSFWVSIAFFNTWAEDDGGPGGGGEVRAEETAKKELTSLRA